MDESTLRPINPQHVDRSRSHQDLCGYELAKGDEFVLHTERTFGQPAGAALPCVHLPGCPTLRHRAVGRLDRAVAEAIWHAVAPLTRTIFFCPTCAAVRFDLDDEV